MTDKPFIDRIKSLIQQHAGGNNSEFARLLEVRPQNIDHWINRGSFPSNEHLVNLKEKLGVNINWLITGIGPTYIIDATPGKPIAEKQESYLPGIDPNNVLAKLTPQEVELVMKLINLLRNKPPGIAEIIQRDIETLLQVPDGDAAVSADKNKKVA